MRELKPYRLLDENFTKVAPSRVRELKRSRIKYDYGANPVAPSRVRELKLQEQIMAQNLQKSHPHGCVN